MTKYSQYVRRNDYFVICKQMRGDWIPNFVDGKIYSTVIDGYLTPSVNDCGYQVLSIDSGYGKHTVTLHRALWVMRHGIPCNPDMEVDHINHNKQDNRLCNLRLVTVSDNHRNRPEKFARAEAIRAEREAGATTAELASKYQYSQRMIRNIVANERYVRELYPGTEVKSHLHLKSPAKGGYLVWRNK